MTQKDGEITIGASAGAQLGVGADVSGKATIDTKAIANQTGVKDVGNSVRKAFGFWSLLFTNRFFTTASC